MYIYIYVYSQATKPPPPPPPNFSFLFPGHSLKSCRQIAAIKKSASQPANDVRQNHSTFSSKPSTIQQLAKTQLWGSF